jgi:NADPH-dependent 2,4-dienoyl-CoA reductase/sulfur reductase-like enzyme
MKKMKKNYDVIVIGGSAAGKVAASTAKSHYPEKNVLVIRIEDKSMVPCGIPYIFGTLKNSESNISPDQGMLDLGVEVKFDKVIKIDTTAHICETSDGSFFTYKKLIMATGSLPYIPKYIKGNDLENVFTVRKDKNYLDIFQEKLKKLKKVAVIGAGFIGVELSDELNKVDNEVTLIELQPRILRASFDRTASLLGEELLSRRGIRVLTGVGVKEIQGKGKVESILLTNGDTIEVDAVVLSIGYVPNTKLATESGISVNNKGFIKVDTFMRTHTEDIFAAGDCAQKRDFITGKITPIMLASTACAEARVAGMNLFELSTIKTFNGTIGIYCTNIGDTSFGVAGITEKRAKDEGFLTVTGSFTGKDKHPGKLTNTHTQRIKLTVSKRTGLILGGEVIGGTSTGELTNVIGFIIQNKMTVSDLLVSQIGTQPMLTASPSAYPLIKAAEEVSRKLR